jgi:hypothetical protein
MAISAELIRKLLAVANDSSTSEPERAIALARLAEAHGRHPELFPTFTPGVRPASPKARPEASKADRERERFLELQNWRPSTRSPGNLVHVAGDAIVTVFPNRFGAGWAWSVSRGDGERPRFSPAPLASQTDAMRDVWAAIAPRSNRGRA